MMMKKAILSLVFLTALSPAFGLELGKGMIVSKSKHMVEVFVSEEREKYGDVNATCTLFDKDDEEIDTVSTRFTQNRMPLYFDGFNRGYWQVYSVSCRLSRQG